MVNTKGLKQGAVLAALYNNSKPFGMGFLHADSELMTEQEAEELLGDTGRTDDVGFKVSCHTYFDYLKGRVMKVDLSNPAEFDERLYDRDNGPGAAQKVIQALRAEG